MPPGLTRPSEPPSPGNEPPPKRQARNHPLAGRARLLMPPGFTSARKTGDSARTAAGSVRSTPAPSTAAPSTAPSRAHSPARTAASSQRDASPSSPTAGAGTSHSGAGRRRAVSSSVRQAPVGLADKGKGRASQVAANTGMGRLEVDTLRELENTVESLQSRLQIMEDQVKKLTRENSRLSVGVTEMKTTNEEQRELGDEMVERVQEVEGRVTYLKNLSMDDGEQEGGNADAVGGAPVDEGAIVASASKSDLKTRAFFACIRAVLLGLMGIRKKDTLPEVMRRGFWSAEDLMDPKRLLRPRWDDGWPVNRAGWVGEVVRKVKQDGRKWSTSLSQEMLSVLPDDVVEDGLETCFGTLAMMHWNLL